jgi:predicted amidohydrolase
MTEAPAHGVAVVQFAPTDDRNANLAAVREFASLAVRRGAELVVFPEYSSWFEAEFSERTREGAEPLDGAFVDGAGEIARELGIHLVFGLLEAGDGQDARVRNTIVALDPDGEILATYRKQHLYDAFGQTESTWVQPGALESPQTFAWHGFTVGLQTCYDIRFPEVTRRLVDAGADLMLVPAEWVRGPLKEHHWRTLVTARAIENTIYLAAADHAPPIGVGNSMVVDPMGVELVTIGETTGVAVAHLSPERVAAVRRINPALALRRYSVVPRD